jgi:hypothetical protein
LDLAAGFPELRKREKKNVIFIKKESDANPV